MSSSARKAAPKKERQAPKPGSVHAMLQSARSWLTSAVLTSYNILQLLLWARVAAGLVITALTANAAGASLESKFAFLCKNIFEACGRRAFACAHAPRVTKSLFLWY